MLQNIILVLVIIFLIAGAFFWMWKLSKWLVIPIQIILFVLLISVVVKVFVNKDNAKRLGNELTNTRIAEEGKKTVSGAFSALTKDNSGEEIVANSMPTSQTVIQQKNADSETKEKLQISPAADKKQKQPAKSEGVNFIDML